MTRSLRRLPVALLVVALAACGGASSSSPVTSVTSAATPSSSPAAASPSTASPSPSSAAPTTTATPGSATAATTVVTTAAPAPAAATGGACALLDPATIQKILGLEVGAGTAAEPGGPCVWQATDGTPSPALDNMMKAFTPVLQGLAGSAPDPAAVAAASRQTVAVSLLPPDPDRTTASDATDGTDTTDPEDADAAKAFVRVDGVGKQAAVVAVPRLVQAGGGMAFALLNDDRVLFVQVFLANPTTSDAIVALLRAAAGRT